MAVSVTNPQTQEEVELNRVHMESLRILQPNITNATKRVTMKLRLMGEDSVGESVFGTERVTADIANFDQWAVSQYMQATGATYTESLQEYARALQQASDANILEVMAYVNRGTAIVYNEFTGEDAQVTT